MKNRLLVLFIALGMLTSVGTFVVLQSKAPHGVNEYHNEKYGYSFQYPATCTFGPMPGECKQNPWGERPEDCLCFLNAEDQNTVVLQSLQSSNGQDHTLASIKITHYESPAFNPPPDVELILWLKNNFSGIYSAIPGEPNTTLGGVPAVELIIEPSPSYSSYSEVFALKDGNLFAVGMLAPTNEANQMLYDQILSSFFWQE